MMIGDRLRRRNKIGRVVAPGILTVVALSLGISSIAMSAPAIDIQGHRGARGLLPENSLAGFAKALAIGVTTLELDTVITRDGVIVIAHDPRLNPDILPALPEASGSLRRSCPSTP